MAEYTVDTLAIEISANSKDAAANIQGLAEALSKLKDSLRGSTNGMSKLAERLKEIRGAAIGTNQSVTRMSELLNAITRLKDIKINKSIPDRIKELVAALSTLKDTDIKFTKENAQAIRRFGEALQGIKDVTISKSLPERIGALVREVGTLTDDDIRQLEKLAASLEHLRGVDLSGFGNIMTETRRRAQEAKQEAKEAERLAAQQTTVTVDPTPIDGASDKVRTLQRELNELRRKAARIDVQSDGLDNAKHQIDEMRSRLKDVSRGKITVDSEQLDETKSKIAKIREELDKVSVKRKVNIDHSSLSKLFNSIKRIALYRGIRTMIRGITEAFSTGIKDLYQYSNMVGTSFAPAMDRAASAILFFKNSLGSMVAPLLETLIPVLETVVDRVASIVDWLAQLFAALSGKSTYSKAVKSTTEFAKAATGAAKAMERYLAPFDELNVIQNNATGKSGSGATNYGKMFEEAEISSNVLELAKKIQPILDKIKEIASVLYEDLQPIIQWILDHALEVAAAFAAWKIASGIIGDLDTVNGKLSKIAGLAAVTIGITLIGTNIADILQGEYKNASPESLWKQIIGGALLGGGVAAILGLSVAGAAIAVTVGVALTLAITDIIVNKDRIKAMWENLFEGDVAGAMVEYMNGDSWTLTAQQWLTDFLFGEGTWEKGKQNLEKYGNDAFLLPLKIQFSIIDKETGDVVEHTTVGKWLSEKLASLFGGKIVEINSGPDPTLLSAAVNTDWYNFPKELIENGPSMESVIESIIGKEDELMKKQDEVKTNTEINWGVFKDFLPTTLNEAIELISDPLGHILDKVTQTNTDAETNTKDKWDQISKDITDVSNPLASMIEGPWATLLETVTSKNGVMEDETIGSWNNIKTSLKAVWDYLSSEDALSPWNYIVSKVSEKTDDVKNKIQDKWDELKESLGTTWDSIKTKAVEVFDALKEAIKTPINAILGFVESLANGIINGLNKGIGALNKLNIDVPDWVPLIGGEKFGLNITEIQTVHIPRLATGGFPEDGLFFANHNEIVGKFANGRTAVANNEQIEGGIAAGVAEANEGVISALVSVGNAIVRAIEDSGKGSGVDLNRFARKLYPAIKQLDGVHGTAMVTG